MVESMYSLTCIITGAERFTDYNTTYQWFKDGMVVAVQEMQTLSFPSLTISDAGNYTCTIVLSSNLLNGLVSSNSDPFNVILSCKLSHLWLLMCTIALPMIIIIIMNIGGIIIMTIICSKLQSTIHFFAT